MTEKERKKWQEMKTMGKRKFIIADGILVTGILIGLLLSYVFNLFIFNRNVLLVALFVIPLMCFYGVYNAKKKWILMEKNIHSHIKTDKNTNRAKQMGN